MTSAATLGGWITAGAVTVIALGCWRAQCLRMEAVARACHELRGPLTAALLGCELDGRNGALSAERVQAIEAELRRAVRALEDLAEAGNGGFHTPANAESIQIHSLVQDSLGSWEVCAAAAGVELKVQLTECDAEVIGDRVRLARAIDNLVANAIEHGGGIVWVQDEIDRGSLRVEVSDDGPGLPAPVTALARRARRGRGARGRGLAIAQSIAEEHGGHLGAAPSSGGARLVLELPLAQWRERAER